MFALCTLVKKVTTVNMMINVKIVWPCDWVHIVQLDKTVKMVLACVCGVGCVPPVKIVKMMKMISAFGWSVCCVHLRKIVIVKRWSIVLTCL